MLFNILDAKIVEFLHITIFIKIYVCQKKMSMFYFHVGSQYLLYSKIFK